MSTIAGMFYVRSGTPGQDTPPSGCSMAESENVSEDDNTSCSASEMGCDLVQVSSSKDSSSASSRKNKRKNFMPRNITEYAGSDEDGDEKGHRRNNNNKGIVNNNIDSVRNGDDGDEEDDEDREEESKGTPQKAKKYSNSNAEGDDDSSPQDYVDKPLDLSEDRNDSNPWPGSDKSFLNASFSPNLNNNHSPSPNGSKNASPLAHPAGLPGVMGHHNFLFPPAAVDLRLAGGPGRGEDLSSNHISNSLPRIPQPLPHPFAGASPLFGGEVPENAYEDLIGLYRLAENLRQAGKPSPEIPGIRSLDSPGQPNKMLLPENMARLWAAMQESMTAQSAGSMLQSSPLLPNHGSTGPTSNGGSSNNGISHLSSNSGSNSASPLNLNMSMSPLSYVGLNNLVQQHQISSGSPGTKSPFLSTPNNNNHLSNHNNNNSIFPGQSAFSKSLSKTPKSTGKTPSGRGLTPFPVIREGLLGKGTGPVDYTRYVRRYANASECGFQQCRELNYREHFHCLDCGEGTRVFVKKEEMIRHFKWHKKRDESLQHGFMRYSPMDDCSDRFRNCSHNRKQTHYHCLQEGCEKVYISTSDVQMHANYHRKDSAIIQEGFQRFRAAEDCGTDHCSFRTQRTTHFHCRRPSCSYTFKNKADMEKHKTYHIKDEQLNRDGFKKFMKHEACHYTNCRFSRVCNHIHCIREGCHYVLHSSGQLYSHKRKHERRDSELAYRKFKLAQSLMRGTVGLDILPTSFSDSSSFLNSSVKSEEENSRSPANLESSILPLPDLDGEDVVKKYLQPCKCDAKEDDHFHCKVDVCNNAVLGNAEIAAEHSRNHEAEDRISSLAFFTVDPASFDAQDSTIPCISATCQFQTREKHYHCLWDGCNETLLGTDSPFRRLEHFKAHSERSPRPELPEKCDSLDGFLKTKRGRPPKNRMIEVSAGATEAIFTSFKLPKLFGSVGNDDSNDNSDVKDPIGFHPYPEGTACPDSACVYNNGHVAHYHCGHPRCHFSVTDVMKLPLHLRDFHSNVDILDGYAYFDRTFDCKEDNCEYGGNAEHFHCTRDGQSFLRYTSLINHEATIHENKYSKDGSSDEDSDRQGSASQVVKASGTFFPTATKRDEGGDEAMDLSSPTGPNGETDMKPQVTDHSLSRILQMPSPESGETLYGPELACGRPFCKLKRKCHFHCHLCNQAFSELEKLRPHVLKHNNFQSPSLQKPVSEPEIGHSSDDESRNNDSEDQDLKPFPKITSDDIPASIKVDPSAAAFPPTSLHNFLGAYPGAHAPFLFMQQNPLTQFYAAAMMSGAGFPPGVLPPPTTPPGANGSSGASVSSPSSNVGLPPGLDVAAGGLLANGLEGLHGALQIPGAGNLHMAGKLKRPTSASPSSPSSPPDLKKQRLQMRILKDEPVPEGYIRFRFNEDCNYVHCGYREHQTHFHCTREDCGYSFCDKTRFVQHTARHERLDTLMGGDFKQFRANISCGRSNCSYVPNINGAQGQNKASHFHCSKCDFVCTDTNKVVAHRRQHQKLDSIMAAGFEKFTPSQNCQVDACIHAQKQTHYHCLKCSYAVLGLSQMSAHKFRHAD